MGAFLQQRQVNSIELVSNYAAHTTIGGTLRVQSAGKTYSGWLMAQFEPVRSQLVLQVSDSLREALPTVMRRPRSEFVPGHQLQKIYGAPFDEETYRTYRQEFKVPVLIEGYGMSEIPGALNNPFLGPHKVGSMGKPSLHPDPAITLAELRIADDDGNFLPAGKTGELVVHTPMVMKAYYRDEAQTRAAFRDGWFLTGDLAIKVPRYVVFVDSLPHTPTHRVAKFKLREDATLLARAVDLQAVKN